MSTWLRTEPKLYLVQPPLVAATSTASEMAIPSEPGDSGSFSSTARPEFVLSEGLGVTVAPKACIMLRRYGFWSYEIRTMYTSHSRSKREQASARELPHWPAPV